MRTAEQWQEELCGETSVNSIRAIQMDAIAHAMTVVTQHVRSRDEVVEALADIVADLSK